MLVINRATQLDSKTSSSNTHLKITFLGWWIPWMFLTPWGAGEWICACCWCCCCCIPFVNVTFRTGCCFGSRGCWGRWGWPSGWKKPASSPPCWNQQHNRRLNVQAPQALALSSLLPHPARSVHTEHPAVCPLKRTGGCGRRVQGLSLEIVLQPKINP